MVRKELDNRRGGPNRRGRDVRSGAVNRRKAILRTMRRILTLMLAILAVPLVIQAYESPNLRVGNSAVEGTELVDSSEITALLPVYNESMLWINPGDLAARVMQVPGVESASVHFRFPGQLVVRVQERHPRGIVRTKDKAFFFDGTGLVTVPAHGDRQLVEINYAGGQDLAPGSRLDPSAIVAAATLDELLRGDSDLPGKHYDYAPESGVTVVAENGLKVIFGGEEDLDYKVAAFRAVLKTARAQKRTVQLIDVRHGERPYFR